MFFEHRLIKYEEVLTIFIWPINEALTGITTSDPSEPGSIKGM